MPILNEEYKGRAGKLVECMKKELSEFKFPQRRGNAYFSSLDLVSSTVLSAWWVHDNVF